MPDRPIYMDNHATTRVDPRVVQAMLPFFTEKFGNAGSISHAYGWEARDAVDAARISIARLLGAGPKEIIFTSGATESNNLALRGLAERQKTKGKHLISATTEHKAVLDPLDRLSRHGFEVTLLPVEQAPSPRAGMLDPQRVDDALRDDTLMVSVMLANNEIGAIQPLHEIGEICARRNVLLHCDATQAVGKMAVDVRSLPVDLMSFSGHKIYGPKGIGGLYCRRQNPKVRLSPLIEGGGQEGGLRSGTLNVPGIVGLAAALELSVQEMPQENARLAELRRRLHDGLKRELDGVTLNGPALELTSTNVAMAAFPYLRLAGNLNLAFAYVNGEALMMSMKEVAVSSGSACTSTNPEPSHVLRALGLPEDHVRSSLRFGLGRFNTEAEVDRAINKVAETVRRLRKLSSLA